MIAKHIDLVAIGFLLLAAAALSGAKHAIIMTMSGPATYLRIEDGRQVRLPVMPAIPTMPLVPRVPRVPLQRD